MYPPRGMPMNCPYTVQKCDGFFERYEAISLDEARALVLQSDWEQMEMVWQERIRAGQSHCPYNLVFFQGKHSLRIYKEQGEWVLVCTYKWGLRKFLGWIYPMGMFDPLLRGLSQEQVMLFLQVFFEGDPGTAIALLKDWDQGIDFGA